MPSPFPGMDPYLERPAYWRDLHQSLIYCFRAQLNAILPEGYAASAEERCLKETIREPFLEIRTTDSEERLVTVIELLSPTNKNGDGANEYLKKQRDVLASHSHFLEIDLLRTGAHLVAASRRYLEEYRAVWDYLVCLTRADDRENHDVWPIRLRDPLPCVAVPLDALDVPLDLQAAFTRAYDEGPYPYRVRYDQPVDPPLNEGDAQWARTLLTT